MKRLVGAIPFLLLLVPTIACALQLRWSNGADTLTFVSDTRCVLILVADSTEALPQEWRLAWQADTSGVIFAVVDSLEACAADTAKVSALITPQTPVDSLAHIVTAQFCSEAGPAKIVAYYVLNQPGGSRGRLKVVALDPADASSNTVIESNEVTYNGGGEGNYAPVLLRAESDHATAELRVRVVGAGLDSIDIMTIGAPDGLWSVSLTIDVRDSVSIEAIADVYTLLPDAVVQATTTWGASDVVALPGEELSLASIASPPDTILYVDPNPDVYPKDFAFFHNTVSTSNATHPWKGLFHLFYIRHFRSTGAEPSIAHAWSEDLKNWRVQTNAFVPNAGWDAQYVWAPSIVQVGNLYYMYYTGVDANGHQRIGYATTANLDTTNTMWSRRSTCAYSADSTVWAETNGHNYFGQQQFRDPWVMPDPDNPGRFLLFCVGQDKKYTSIGRTIVGVARNRPGTLSSWVDLGAYRVTDFGHTGVTRAESPLVARDSSGTGSWRIYFANGDYDPLGHQSTVFSTQLPTYGSAVDTTLGHWGSIDSLYTYLGNSQSVIGWQACEHLQVGKIHLFAAYNGDGIGITRTYWDGDDFVIGYPDLTAVGSRPQESRVRFYVTSLKPGVSSVRFTIESTDRITPRIVIYDVTGRRLRTVVEGREVMGQGEVEWDFRDAHGTSLSTGIYFARLTGAGREQVLRVPIVR